ncbi:MAG: c-type cytochrome [Kiritimatiellia bacterium]|jgi:cbb3-type cytochrome c oxidase subunit III|nr:c-type cytochrome [Kiritimatiellia bacterium]MDP6630417.1 c-type cytochrome [Kiritimatiellia bacterium]MDP6809874.1 c-type cytochrome [Kiritimatiellia bacterium]MDP7024266.1 c-type cytochrome [Kiritimatiellia bacterium]
MRLTLLLSSVLAIGLMLYMAFRETVAPPYRQYQVQYRDELIAQAGTPEEVASAKAYPIRRRQLFLPHLGEADRCISCHVGMEDVRMADQPHPIRTHPGDILAKHDIRKMGCTICHDGQGRATTVEEAHANTIKFWERPRLDGDTLQANCLRCHHVESLPRAATLQHGRKLFAEGGCLGCHKRNGIGGFVGPDLSSIGDASFHVKVPVEEHHEELIKRFGGNVNLAYLYEAVRYPRAQPHDSSMLIRDLSDEDAYALAIYLKSFQRREIPDHIQHFEKHLPQVTGAMLYAEMCSACHGKNGEGAMLPNQNKLGPSLNGHGFQSIATLDFVTRFVAESGSSLMPQWGKSGGLSEAQIDAVSRHVLSLRAATPEPDPDYVGNIKHGRSRFESRCAGCHGIDGNYEMDLIGPTLSSPEFLSYASEAFITKTIVDGREDTAMPKWSFLRDREVKDLTAYLTRARGETPSVAAVQQAAQQPHAATQGRHVFRNRCGSCHGMDAEGGLGPSLNTPEFQAVASDPFIHKTVTEGRRGTAMGAWSQLSAQEVGGILAFLRSFPKGVVRSPQGGAVASESRGRINFERTCAPCHGEGGRGLIGPAIGGHDFLNAVDDQFLRETLRYGRMGTAMRANLKGTASFASFSEQEIEEIIAYMRALQLQPFDTIGVTVTQGDVPLGRELFARNCAQCHGDFGGGGSGPAVGRPGFLATVSDGFLEGTIANGRSGTEMRSFSHGQDALTELSEHEIRSVVSYLRSQADVARQTPKLALGTAARGADLYARQCAQCHGTATEEGFAPRLLNPQFLAAASDSYLQATMSLGHGTTMRSMIRGGAGVVEMTGREINDLIQYLREAL